MTRPKFEGPRPWGEGWMGLLQAIDNARTKELARTGEENLIMRDYFHVVHYVMKLEAYIDELDRKPDEEAP